MVIVSAKVQAVSLTVKVFTTTPFRSSCSSPRLARSLLMVVLATTTADTMVLSCEVPGFSSGTIGSSHAVKDRAAMAATAERKKILVFKDMRNISIVQHKK